MDCAAADAMSAAICCSGDKYLIPQGDPRTFQDSASNLCMRDRSFFSGAEIDEKMPKGKPLDTKALGASQMPYLNGVFYETLRLWPPVPQDSKIAFSDDVLPDGTKVPKNTMLLFMPYVIGRDPQLYKDPLVFRPERWIPFEQPPPHEFPVFQAGPRICLGMDMAIFEAKIVAVELLRKFHFDLVPGQEITYGQKITMNIRNGDKEELLMTVQPRYPTARDCIIVGQALSWAPATECGDSSNWSVSPDLPVGLVLEPGSGKIVGTATEITDAKSYEISATNSGGKATVSLTLEVKAGRPKAPIYPMSEEGLVLHVGEAFEVAPEDCGADVTFSISPSLPSGLHLDEVTGVISGTPQEEADLMDYEVTVSNMSGSEAASFPLTVRPEKPHDLRYPDLAESYQVGDTVSLQAEVQGMVKDFVVVPALPEGLSIDGATGEISGTLQSLCDLSTHTVTASSEEGKATAELKFTVVVSAPSNFTYPMASPSYAVGEPIDLEAEIEGSNCSFTVEPALPEGISLDGTTGQITGTPLGECPETTYTLTATNSSGSTSTSLTFQVEEVQTVDAEGIDQNFAEMLEAIEDLADMVEEPSKVKSFGDWMIWMVHRAHLNDPTLTDFNFNNLHMPPAHLEARIAPKLAKAMANNTHIHTLSLVNSNLQKAEGTVLAQSLALNSSVVQVHLENNCLDSTSVQAFATALLQNPSSKLETLRFSPQKGTGNFFGRPAEEAFGQLLEKNEIILRLGLNCNDAHWRNHINRALLRNNDFARRRRKKQAGGEEEEVQAEEKSLRRVVLTTPPSTSGSLAKDGPQNAVRGFVVAHHKFPTPLGSHSEWGRLGR
eukprot:symbB.v1.2.004601.t1/scaffold259.1/size252385/3